MPGRQVNLISSKRVYLDSCDDRNGARDLKGKFGLSMISRSKHATRALAQYVRLNLGS